MTSAEFANSIPHLLLGNLLRLLSHPTDNYLPHFLLAQSLSSSITSPEFAHIRHFRPTIIYHLSHYFSISKDPWHNILNHFTSWNLFLAHSIHLYHYQLREKYTGSSFPFFRSFLSINTKDQGNVGPRTR